MENVNNEKTIDTLQTTEVEEDLGKMDGEVSLGKFKDVKTLLSAYNSLQSEFTKRCQRLKELEGALNEKTEEKSVSLSDGGTTNNNTLDTNSMDKEEILKEYLKDVLGAKQQVVLIGDEGTGFKTPNSKPKSIAEAGALAKELLKNN